MKANELMIGGWVQIDEPDKYAGAKGTICSLMHHQSDDGCYFQVFVQDLGVVMREVFNEDLRPIPLTAEILEKNGLKPFKIDKLTEQATAKWWAKGGDYYVKQYNFVFNGFQPTYSFGCHPHTLIERLRYVHELQHALRLCGIDKEIVL